MSITLILVGILTLITGVSGFKKGMVKEIASVIALVVTFIVLALIIMIFTSFTANETDSMFIALALLLVLGLVYSLIKTVLKSVKALASLPLIRIFDKLFGFLLGIAEAIIIVWIIYMINDRWLLGNFGEMINRDRQNSMILQMIYNFNFFVMPGKPLL